MNLFKKLLYSESYQKGIVLSIGFNIFSKGLLFLVNISIAYYFGTNTETDVYFYINSTLLILVAYINNIDNAILVPELMRLKHQENEGSYRLFVNFFLYLYFLIGIVGVFVLFFFNTQIYGLISNFDKQIIVTHRTMFLISSFNFLLLIIINYLVNVLTSLKYFTLPMVISGINSILILCTIIIGHDKLGTTGILIGATIAQLINLLLLLILMKVNLKWKFDSIPKIISIRKKVWKDIAWVELGQVSALFTNYLPIYLLSGFGNGAITAMNFGKSIAEIPNSLFTTQYSYIIGIKFNELYHKSKLKEVADTFISGGKLLIVVLIPIGCFLAFHSKEVVRILLQHGSFNKADANTTAVFLSIFAIAIPFFAVGSLVVRLCFAAQRARFIFFFQIISNVILIALIYAGTVYYNIYGYAYGYLAFYIINMLISFFICRLLLPDLKYLSFISYFFAIIIAYIMLSVVLYLIHGFTSNYIWLCIDSLLFFSCFLYFGRKWLNPLLLNIKRGFIKY